MRRFCGRCGRRIEKESLRYVVQIKVYAAYDPLEITREDLLKDHTDEIERLVRQCEGMTKSELMRDVYAKFRFNLCRPCQKVYVADPLPPVHPEPPRSGFTENRKGNEDEGEPS